MLPTFVLASASPARKRLLELAGITPMVQPSGFDESRVATTDPEELVKVLSHCKAETVASQLTESENASNQPYLVMGCDSVLALKGEIYGKPADAAEAIARWQHMRGQVGQLCTGHTLIDTATGKVLVRCQVTQVHFAQISDREIEAYASTEEPLHCAGCFALEGKGGLFVERLEGCHSNVIGLSLPLLRQMLHELGYDAINFWASATM